MTSIFTSPPKRYAFGYPLLVGLLCWLGLQTPLLGLPLPISANGANQPPVVVATSTTLSGNSPLSVTFTGNKSYDPDGDPITYQWDFGDGSTSAQANPVHVFTQTRGSQGVIIQSYTAKLTVSDNKGGSSVSTNFFVSIPNTAPTARITYPVNNDKYVLDRASFYSALATVTDELPTDLTYAWTAKLRRNNRDMLVRTTGGGNPNFDILPIGCDGDVSYYVISLKVTDLGGLSSTVDSIKLYPDCNSPTLNVAALTATQLSSSSVRLNWFNPSVSFDDVLVVGKAGSGFIDIPNNATYTTSNSFTTTGTAFSGGKALYQGTSTSLVVTDLTPGQTYYFRVYTHKGSAPWTGAVWTAGVEVNTKASTPNRSPVAVITSTPLTGMSPLSVTFTGDKSYDPDGDPITYSWDFGDGNSSSAANPVHVFTPILGRQGVPQTDFTVRMFIGDNKGGYSGFQTFTVSLTNPAPTAKITTPVNLSKYALDKATSYTLAAAVTDDVPSRLNYFWQGKLRLNGKDQYPTTMSGANPVFTVSPIGCDGIDDYYYVFTLKVTDVGNLSAQDSVKIYPNCNSPKLNVTGLTATTLTSSSVRLNWTNPTIPFDKVIVAGRAGSTLTGYIPEPNSIFIVNSSFTANASNSSADGVKVLYEGTGNSVVITDLTPGQLYYFRVYARAGAWSGGVEVSATPTNPTSTSSVMTIASDKCYRIVSRGSGKLLGVEGSSQDDGALVKQRTDGNLLSQRWRFESVGNGFYKIGAVHSNKAIDVIWGSQDNGMGIEQWAFNGEWSFNQHFALQRNASGYFQIIARHSSKALEVQDGNTNEGGMVVQNTPNGGINQQWSIEERACTTTTPPSSTTTAPPTSTTSITSVDPAKCYRIQSRSSGLTLNVPDNSYNDGTTLKQNINSNQPWQKWKFTPAEAGYYTISVLHNQKGIQVNNSSTTDNATLEQWTYWGGSHQQWTVQRNSEGFFTFSNRNSNKAIAVKNASTTEGADIVQLTLGSGQNQQWSIAETTCPAGARVGASEVGVSFRLSPNPARDHILVDLSPAVGKPVDLKLVDFLGRTHGQIHLETAPIKPYRLSTDQLSNGLYLIQITPDGQLPITLRLLIQR